MTDTQKAYAAIAILGIWGVLVGLALTPMEQFVRILCLPSWLAPWDNRYDGLRETLNITQEN